MSRRDTLREALIHLGLGRSDAGYFDIVPDDTLDALLTALSEQEAEQERPLDVEAAWQMLLDDFDGKLGEKYPDLYDVVDRQRPRIEAAIRASLSRARKP